MFWLSFWRLTSVQFTRNVYTSISIFFLWQTTLLIFQQFRRLHFYEWHSLTQFHFSYVFFMSYTPPECRFGGEKKPITTIAFNCVIFEIIFFFGCRYRYCYCSHCFSCNNNIFHFRFMSIHIGIIEHKRDLRELQYLHGMKKRQRRWIAVFWIFFFSNYDVWWTVLMGEGGGRRCAKKNQQMNLRRFYMAKRSRARFHTWLTTVWMD